MAIKKTETKKEAQGLLVYQNLPALSRSLFGDPELWVRTHQVILTNWSRLNQVFDFKKNPEKTEIQKMAFLITQSFSRMRNNRLSEFESRCGRKKSPGKASSEN
jgi:hypothetical protein